MIPSDIYISFIYIWTELYRLRKHSFPFLFPQFSIVVDVSHSEAEEIISGVTRCTVNFPVLHVTLFR